MKLRKDDKVVVIAGRDRGKTGTVLAVLPEAGKVVVEGVGIVKRHTKADSQHPRGGILDITKPIAASKVMALDPKTGRPARIGHEVKADGTKERIFKVSPNQAKKPAKAKTEATPAAKPKKSAPKPTTKEKKS